VKAPCTFKGKATVKVGPVPLTIDGSARLVDVYDIAHAVRLATKESKSKGRAGAAPIRLGHVETLSPLNPLGVMGTSESGTIPTVPAVVRAVENALAPLGVQINRYPLNPEPVVDLIDAAQALT